MRKQLIGVCVLLLIVCVSANSRAQWRQTNGPLGGMIHSLATNGTILFAGSVSGGVYRSTDSGAHWSAMNNGLTNTAINALLSRDGDLFAATNNGVFRSKDSGASWMSSNTDISKTHISTLTASGPNLFATTYNGSIFTTDDGASWHELSGTGLFSGGVSASNGADVFAVGEADSNSVGAISYSSDNGRTWTLTNTGSALPIQYLAASGQNLFAFVWADGVMRSSDRGKSWIYMGASPGEHVYSVLTIGTTLVVGSDNGLQRSIDSGATWQSMSTTMPIPMYSEVNAVQVIGSIIFAGTYDRGVFRSADNGATWQEANGGLAACDIATLGISNGSILTGITNRGGLRSTDNGANWSAWNNEMPNAGISAIFVRDKNLLAATDSGVFRSRNEGSTWTRVADAQDYVIRYINAFAQSDSFLFATSRSVKVLRSEDDGITWKSIYDPEAYGILSLAANGPNICIATYAVEVSHDNGASWNINNDVPGANILISSGSNFFAGTWSGVFRSDDGGRHWTKVGNGLTDTVVTALVTSGENLFAGTRNGNVYLLASDGATWNSVGTGLTSAQITTLNVNDTYLFAGTGGAAIWRRPLSEMIAQSAVADFTVSAQQLHIYPNPVSESATISFTPDASGDAEILIVNLLGQEVARVYSGMLDASEHTFTWVAPKIASPRGMYECVVHMNGKMQTLPLMVTR